jgi:hypothetical protein
MGVRPVNYRVFYDARGRVVRALLRPDKPMKLGKYRLIWNAKNENGMDAPAQIRFRPLSGTGNTNRKAGW